MAVSTVARWANGLTAVEHRPRRPDYSFLDLVSMLIVRDLVRLGMRPSEVHAAEEHLRHRYHYEHPFAVVRLKTDGVDVFYEASPTIMDQITSANRGGQEVIKPAIHHALKDVSYESGIAAAWSPTPGVILDPRIQFGEPCVADTRVTTSQLAVIARSSAHRTPAEIGRLYRIDENAVRRALDFESRLTHHYHRSWRAMAVVAGSFSTKTCPRRSL